MIGLFPPMIPWRTVILVGALLLTSGLPALSADLDPIDAADAAYQKARTCYYDLKKSAAQQKHRDAWEACLRDFLAVQRDYPTSERAAAAAFTVGKLYEELYDTSKNVEDLRIAIVQYEHFTKQFKTHRLADDALYHVGKIRWEGFHQKGPAKSVMWKIIRWYPESDMAIEAKRFLREIDGLNDSPRPSGALLNVKPRIVTLPPSPASAPTPVAPTAPVERPLTIVIDPGHGGKDTGAIGAYGTLEKDVTLAISQKLAALLREQLPCRVVLTRDRDISLTLDERNAIGNRRKADLFISIHANAATAKDQHGIQTYYLNNASDEAAQRLAARENTVAGKTTSQIEAIVSTMLQNVMTDASRALAQAVHAQVVGSLERHYTNVRDQGVRTALFYVLVGAKSPSILVETSYISHAEEERRLRDPKYQLTLARAISRGIQRFVSERSTVAHR